jgi:hypothetical protein
LRKGKREGKGKGLPNTSHRLYFSETNDLSFKIDYYLDKQSIILIILLFLFYFLNMFLSRYKPKLYYYKPVFFDILCLLQSFDIYFIFTVWGKFFLSPCIIIFRVILFIRLLYPFTLHLAAGPLYDILLSHIQFTILYNLKIVANYQIMKFRPFVGIETLKKCHILKLF